MQSRGGFLKTVVFALGAFGLSIAPALNAAEKLPEGATIVSLAATPQEVALEGRYSYAQMLITARLANGDAVDVTRIAEASVSGDLAEVSATGVVRSKKDGAGQITFKVGGQSLSVPIAITNHEAEYHPSFVRDVMPALSKMGCNAGTCHGSLNGKNGFKLSLRGYDPLFDHRALTDDIASRRINRAAPDQSLMLLKPSGAIPHVGGVVTQLGQPYYEIVRSWIGSGVKLDLDSPRVASIEVYPKNPIVPLPGMKQQMRVLAKYADGSMRDVTLETFIDSGNTEVAEPDKLGLVTVVRRGEAPVLARFEGAYTATTITVMGDRSGYEWKDVPANNFVDELVDQKLKRVKSVPSELCNDAEFVRRVTLDLTGLPPSTEQVRAFLADTRDTRAKRDELIDRLIGSGDYVELWTNKWADLLQVNRKFLGEQGAFALREWIKQAVASNMPYDRFVYTVLTASGSTLENPPAAYYKVLRTPEDTMENTTQLFLGVRFNCNHCHDHPFERWTQGQYYHLAAYFAQVGRKEDPAGQGRKIGETNVEGAKPLVEAIYDAGSGDVLDGGTGKPASPGFPYQHADVAPTDQPRREQLARWVTSKENQYFSKSYVNRLWGYLFGRGIIDPTDDIRAGNPPTNPELLEKLTSEFASSGFNMQHVLRLICKSRAYQSSIVTNQWNADDEINFSHAIARRLPAEVLYDSIQRATGSISRLPGVPAGYRAAQLPDVGLTLPSGFFEVFGRPARESSCECERSTGMMLGPVMTLVNGPTIAEAIADPSNELTKLVGSQPDDAKVVDEIFMRTLSRPAAANEIAAGVQALRSDGGELAQLQALVTEHETALAAKQSAWEASQAPPSWTALEPSELKSSMGSTFVREADRAIRVEGTNSRGSYTITLPSDQENITAIRLEVLSDPSLPGKGPGRAVNGNLALTEFKGTFAPKADPSKPAPLAFARATADFSQDGLPVTGAIDGNEKTHWAIHPQVGKDHWAIFELKDDLASPGGMVLTFTLDHQLDDQHTIGKFRISVTSAHRPLNLQPLPQNVAAVLAVVPDQRSDAQKAELTAYYRSQDARWLQLTKTLAAATEQQKNQRLTGAQDLAWALINSPAFLFNR